MFILYQIILNFNLKRRLFTMIHKWYIYYFLNDTMCNTRKFSKIYIIKKLINMKHPLPPPPPPTHTFFLACDDKEIKSEIEAKGILRIPSLGLRILFYFFKNLFHFVWTNESKTDMFTVRLLIYLYKTLFFLH